MLMNGLVMITVHCIMAINRKNKIRKQIPQHKQMQ